jgi:hypothetical protein
MSRDFFGLDTYINVGGRYVPVATTYGRGVMFWNHLPQ